VEQLERAGLIRDVRVTPLSMPLRQPYVWARGVAERFVVNLVEIEDDEGRYGIGECTTAPDAQAIAAVRRRVGAHLVGRITTCAEHQIARCLPNLDHGNQIMWQLLRDTIIARPALTPERGQLALAASPGLGFELDRAAVGEAAERFRREAE
jgi:L-alanine-DL-glutamate epimerase-like enolase superfamily enzyme